MIEDDNSYKSVEQHKSNEITVKTSRKKTGKEEIDL